MVATTSARSPQPPKMAKLRPATTTATSSPKEEGERGEPDLGMCAVQFRFDAG
ncbi:hypothetical protein BCR44DRAFT_66624 [Catenaria anguillulae PL171]|uniref:Uncharacterized protein n=1 Tax=Catenaria anguillulae PL171 TaxID=765915 RepID=A0A1Y2H8R3_9FUNG|nr:hypothetical protein BCR44DRAFT_66624 [Catenaria anguillulae PL171]